MYIFTPGETLYAALLNLNFGLVTPGAASKIPISNGTSFVDLVLIGATVTSGNTLDLSSIVSGDEWQAGTVTAIDPASLLNLNTGTLSISNIANRTLVGNNSGSAHTPASIPLAADLVVNGAGSLTANNTTTITASTANTTIAADGLRRARLILAASTTLDVSGGVDEQALTLSIQQDATGGRALTAGTSIKFGTDVPTYTPTSTANAVDHVQLIRRSAGVWDFAANVNGFS